MTDQTNKDLAYQLIGALIPLGAQWAQVETDVHGRTATAHTVSVMKAFGQQLAEIVRLARLEVAENERLRALNTEMREALKLSIGRFQAISDLVSPGLNSDIIAHNLAILAKTESP